MPVDSQHAQYVEALSKWTLVRDCVDGAKAVRAKGELYLPNPDSAEKDLTVRYNAYRARAQFMNVTARTGRAMVGMSYRNDPVIELPSGLEYLESNSTGDGTSLAALGKRAVSELLKVGRIGLLSDYPVAEAGMTEAQVKALKLQSSIKVYPAQNIINWKTEAVNDELILTLITLKEEYEDGGDEFASVRKDQYRVLKLVDSEYIVEIWRDGEKFATVKPRDFFKRKITRIPMVIAGTDSNDADVDSAALYDIAELNIGHYRNSADYEEGVFLHGQPVLHIDTGTTTASEFNTLNPNGVTVGARRGLVTSGGGNATLLQAQSNSAAAEAMDKKENQMVAIGARTIEQGGQAETAEAAKIKHAGDNSVLTNIVQNVSDAITQCVIWCGVYMGVDGEVKFQINEDFYDKGLDPQQIMAAVQLFDRNILAKSDLRANARKTGLIEADRTDEAIDTESEANSPIE